MAHSGRQPSAALAIEDRRRRSRPTPCHRAHPRIVADHLDYLHHGAFFVMWATFEVTAYRTLVVRPPVQIGDSQTGETVGNGALATVRCFTTAKPVGDGHLQGQFAASKDVVGDMLDKRRLHTVDGETVYPEARLAGERVGGDRRELHYSDGNHPSRGGV